MKQHGHSAEEYHVPETGGGNVPLLDQLSIDNGTWLEMEHTKGAYIIPHEPCKRCLVSLHVTLDDFEHGCDLSQVLQKSSEPMPEAPGPEEMTVNIVPSRDKFRRIFR
ncbi:MAG: hypothetical protein WCJ93_07400 [Methanomicrobiales archaeon]